MPGTISKCQIQIVNNNIVSKLTMFHWQWVLTQSSGAFQSWYLGFVFKMATLFVSRGLVGTPMIHHPYMEIFRETSMTSTKIIQSGESLLQQREIPQTKHFNGFPVSRRIEGSLTGITQKYANRAELRATIGLLKMSPYRLVIYLRNLPRPFYNMSLWWTDVHVHSNWKKLDSGTWFIWF